MFDSLIERNIKVMNKFVPPIGIDRSFDVVFLNQVFEHMDSRRQAVQLIQEIYNILNDRGIVVISSPEVIFWGRNFFAGDYSHNNPTSFYSMQQILFDNNFEIKNVTFYTLVFEGYLIAKLLAYFYNFLFSVFAFDLLFGREKGYKIMTALLPSVVLIGQKRESG